MQPAVLRAISCVLVPCNLTETNAGPISSTTALIAIQVVVAHYLKCEMTIKLPDLPANHTLLGLAGTFATLKLSEAPNQRGIPTSSLKKLVDVETMPVTAPYSPIT